MQPLLELKDVTYVYHSINGETYALSNISFQVQDGEFIAIVGPSGCGNAMGVQRKQIKCISAYLQPRLIHRLYLIRGSILSHFKIKIWASSPSQTTLSRISLKYSLFSGTLNVSNKLLNEESAERSTSICCLPSRTAPLSP